MTVSGHTDLMKFNFIRNIESLTSMLPVEKNKDIIEQINRIIRRMDHL